MNFVILSYFRLNSSSIVHLELREFLRNSSRVPFSHTPSPFPPPLPPSPTFPPENRCQRRVADREITASVSRFSSIAFLVHVHQGNSVDRFRGNEQDFAQKHGTQLPHRAVWKIIVESLTFLRCPRTTSGTTFCSDDRTNYS